MNKKISFLIFTVLIIAPLIVYAVNTPEVIAQKVQDLVWFIGAAIVVIGWTIAGIMFLLSMGIPEKMATARKAIIAAVVGTVLVIIAGGGYAIIKAFLDPIIGAGA